MTDTTAMQRRIVGADEERFDRTLAALVGIVEPDSRPAAARPGPLARFMRSHRGSVALGFASVAAIGGLAAIGVRSLPAPAVRDQPASVTLTVPAIERLPAPVQPAAPAMPVLVAERHEPAPVARTPHPNRAKVATASAYQRDVPRRAPTYQAAGDDVRPSARPVQVAALDRRPPVARADDDEAMVMATPSVTVASPERREPPAVRVERRDNVDALRQLRHQW